MKLKYRVSKCESHFYKLGSTANQVVRLIGLLLVFASQK